jgi:hypothetical protein
LAIPAISLPSLRPRRRCSHASGQLSSVKDGEGRRTFVGPNQEENMKHFGSPVTPEFPIIFNWIARHRSYVGPVDRNHRRTPADYSPGGAMAHADIAVVKLNAMNGFETQRPQ